MLPKSIARRTGDKITCDKASLQNAPKNYKGCTSVIHQRLCYGPHKNEIGPNTWKGYAVRHMASLPQSSKWCYPTGTWFGNDDGVHVRGRKHE